MSKETISSLQNPTVKHLVKLRTSSRYRHAQKRVLICSHKLVEELSSQTPPIALYGNQGTPLSEAVLKKITHLPSPEGIVAEFPLPSQSELKKCTPLLALERINDPGNLGTLARTALALGWGGLFLLPGCVDPFHEKVIRASRGAFFHLPWRIGSWEELEKLHVKAALHAYVADMQGQPLDQINADKNTLLLLSNEGEGVSEKGREFGDKISIPISPKVESLNVAIAGAILMHKLYHIDQLRIKLD